MTAAEGDQAPNADSDPASTFHPKTASVLAALGGRGLDLPGVTRPSGEAADDASPRYTVLEQVARGGMGVVMRVRDEDLRRELAMKVLDRAGREPDATASDPRDLGRFLEEAQVTGQLDHPGVPPIHELGLDRDGRLFFTMKLVRGNTFADVIDQVRDGKRGWSTTRALGVVLKVCEALAYAHHKGVIHRDIKPANIMVGRFGETYVMDWGLAKVLDDGRGVEQPSYDSMVSRSIVHTDRKEAVDDEGSSHATLHGDVVGTPAYMAPEQARGDIGALGIPSDIYAVGALLYHLLAGQAPYIEPGVRVSPHSVLRWVIDGPPRPLTELAPDAPAELVAVIEKAMARQPAQRYGDMLELTADLQAFIENRVVRAYQTGAWAEARKWIVRNKPLAAAAGLLLVVTIGALGAVSWVQAQGKAAVEERNELLGLSNEALEGANAQLGLANTQLETTNARLADTNAALAEQRAAAELARAAAETAREEAQANAELAQANAEQAAANAAVAEANERRALVESYAANMTAAVSALEAGAGAAARRHLAACPEDLRGWDWNHLSLRADPSLHVWQGAESLLLDVVHSPDGKLLATASGPFGNFGPPVREVRLIDAASGETRLQLPTDRTVSRVAFSTDGRLLAYADEQYVTLYDLERGRPRSTRHWLGEGCYGLTFLDADRVLALSVDDDNDLSRVDVWNTYSLEVEFSRESSPAVTAVAASSDGSRVAMGSSDYAVECLSLVSGETLWSVPGEDVSRELSVDTNNLPGATGMVFDDLGERLVLTGRDGSIRLLDARDGRELARRILEQGVPFSPRFHPDGPWVVVGDSTGSVRFLDADTLDPIERLSGHDSRVLSLSISADGDRIVSGDLVGNLRVWDGRPGAASLIIASPAAVDDVGAAAGQRTIAFSPDGRLVAWNSSPRAALVADALTGEVLYRLAEVDSAVATLAFTPDGRRLLVQSEVGGIMTVDVASGRLLSSAPSGRYADWAAFDRTGSLLALVESRTDYRIDLRLVDGGVLAATLTGHEESITNGQFTSDTQRLVTCSLDGTIRTWSLSTGRTTQLIAGGDDFLRIELFDGDRRAVTTTLDPTRSGLSVWDLERGELIVRHPARGLTLRGSMHPDGRLWAGTSSGGSVSLWSLERGEMFSLPAGDFGVTHVRFDPTGTRLAALDRGGHLFLWETVHPRDRRDERVAASRLARRVGEARALVDALVDEHLLMSRVILALQADPDLDDELRDAAVRAMRVRGDDARWIAARAWERLLPPGADDDALTSPQAVAVARSMLPTLRDLRDRWSGYADAWEPLLYALHIIGDDEQAAGMLQAARDTGYSFQPQGPQANLAVEAMVLHALGDDDGARFALKEAKERYDSALRDTPGEESDLRVTGRLIALAEARLGDG